MPADGLQSRKSQVTLSFNTFLNAQRMRSKPLRPDTIDGRRRLTSMRILLGTCLRPPDRMGFPSRPRRWNMCFGMSRRRIPFRSEYCVSFTGEPWDSISMLPGFLSA